ncbi:MAG: hypothetical protein Q8Q33_08590 [Chlamydiota bacterium]|nr:hypothetical protein [Chlamydiota bacterium]
MKVLARRSHYCFILICMLPFLFLTGCPKGDVQKAPGTYTITVVNPDGKSAVGTARVTASGNLYVVVIESGVLNVAFSGELEADTLTASFTDEASFTNTATIRFTWDRDRFTGSLQRSNGLYTLEAVRIGP